MGAKIKKTLSFDEKVLEKSEALAAKDNRSLNNWLEWLMMKEIEASFACSSGNITDEIIMQYIENQDVEPEGKEDFKIGE